MPPRGGGLCFHGWVFHWAARRPLPLSCMGHLISADATSEITQKLRAPRPPLPTPPFLAHFSPFSSFFFVVVAVVAGPLFKFSTLHLNRGVPLHDAVRSGVEPRTTLPPPVHLLRLEAVQLDASADGNGRGGREDEADVGCRCAAPCCRSLCIRSTASIAPAACSMP